MGVAVCERGGVMNKQEAIKKLKEKEKLYTVEIPDPYYNYRFLSRNDNGIYLDASNYAKWKQKERNQLTEAEIKQDFEWAWQWAKEVENDTEI